MKKILKRIITLTIIIVLCFLIVKRINYVAMEQKQKEYNEKINIFLDGVKKWKENNQYYNNDAIIVKLNLNDLIKEGYASSDVINPLTNHVFDNIKFCIINNNGDYSYEYDDGTNCGNTLISYEHNPKMYDGYVYEEIISIDFSDLEGLEYYIKTSSNAISNININYVCGKEEKRPCREIHATKNIKANVWYKVPGNMKLTYDEHNDDIGYIYTLTTDEKGFKNVTTSTISKIDRKSPVVVLDFPISSTNTVSVKIKNMIDNETDIADSTCNYGTTLGEYNTTSMKSRWGKLSKCTINYKLKDKTYYYQVCATDKVGNVGCAYGNSLLPSVKKTILDYDDNLLINFNNKKKNITYYIKSNDNINLTTETIAYCGKDVLPGNCINNKVTSLVANVWYQVSSEVKVNLDVDATIYGVTYIDDIYVSSFTAKIY